ncbi:MAG: hypothetical protein ABR503_00060 [Chitinophagaceae bacterium]
MKSLLLFFAFVSVLTSCTTAYHTGQTPDDVYYSPARLQDEYVRVNDRDEKQYRGTDSRRNEDDYYTYDDDRYLRYKIRNRDRWSYLDDYYRDPYAYNYYNKYYYNTYSYSRSYWNTYFNPYSNYCSPYPGQVIVVNSKAPVYSKPRTYNLHVFDDPKNNSYTPKAPRASSRDYNTPSDNRSNTRNTGNILRDVFGSSNSSNNNSSSSSSSSSNNSSNKSSTDNNSNKSSSGSAPVRKF